jgi:hypothetical protein
MDIGEKVLERLATSDKTTIVIEKQPDGKMRVTSGSWDGEKVFLKDQVLKVWHANADAGLHVARKTKADDWDPPYESYDPQWSVRPSDAKPSATTIGTRWSGGPLSTKRSMTVTASQGVTALYVARRDFHPKAVKLAMSVVGPTRTSRGVRAYVACWVKADVA